MRIYKNEPFTDESDPDKLINGIGYIFCDLLYVFRDIAPWHPSLF